MNKFSVPKKKFCTYRETFEAINERGQANFDVFDESPELLASN